MTIPSELMKQTLEQQRFDSIERIKKEMSKAEADIGCCTATHTLSRNYKRVNAKISKITGVTLDSYDYREKNIPIEDLDNLDSIHVIYLVENIAFSIDASKYKACEFSVTNTYESITQHAWYRYKLSIEDYENIKNNVLLRTNEIGYKLREMLPKFDMYITNGESSVDDTRVEVLIKNGYKFVKLPTEIMVYLLSWHPFLYGDKLMESPDTIKFILNKIDALSSEISRLSNSPYSFRLIETYRKDIYTLNQVLTLLNYKPTFKQ